MFLKVIFSSVHMGLICTCGALIVVQLLLFRAIPLPFGRVLWIADRFMLPDAVSVPSLVDPLPFMKLWQ